MMFGRAFPEDRTSVIEARHFAASTLEGMPEDFVDAVVLMVSELATNAVQHARSHFEIKMECTRGQVLVEVIDFGQGMAAPRTPRSTDIHGRGLQIVRALADSWGVRPSSSELAKVVWFSLKVPIAANELEPRE